MSDAIDRLVRESRPDMGTEEARSVDWASVDRELFQRIEADRRAERAGLESSRAGLWAIVAGGLAAAAAVAVVVGKSRDPQPIAMVHTVEDGAGSVVALEGDGQLTVDGKPAATGAELRLGAVLETHGAQATIERPGKVTFVIERGSKATVSRVQGALVLALERGAVEAQVVPVPNGEAFAVDVGTSRVAVHGTHLRVARSGEHVVVDLSEGVVSMGPAPRVGSTLGALVTAPAHAEFTAGDPEVTLEVSHDPANVRTAATITAAVTGVQSHASAPILAAAPARVEPDPKLAEPRPAEATGAVPHAEAHPSAGSTPGVHTAAALAEADPEGAIAAAVRYCVASRPHGDNVTVMVSTTVRLELRSDGTVQSARFDPPVAPEVNGCASGPIYATRFSHGGSTAVPVDVRVPASAP